MAGPKTVSRMRQRKLNVKQALAVQNEDELDSYEAEISLKEVTTGVELSEEQEHHLQAVISAAQAAAAGGVVAQASIPTRGTTHTSLPYDEFYQYRFSQPATYIRFSSTVEDVIGCPYDLTEDDDAFLRQLNEKPGRQKDTSTQCTEDQFEEVMNFFEETAKSQQPFSGVGEPPPVLTYDEMQAAFDENIDEACRSFAKEIYEHWKARRLQNGNNGLQPSLKLKILDTGDQLDDNDPYVCFRRREMRQARKTRGRDAQSVEKLKKLRRELEEARQLVAMVRQRELTKREQLSIDRQLFEQRASLRQLKRNLPDQYKQGDDDLLINQKPQKKKPLEITTSQRTPATQLRLPPRPDGRTTESDLLLLSDWLADKENEIDKEIRMKIAQHQKWNENYNDLTRMPLSPPLEQNISSGFRAARPEYSLPTPPASVSTENSGDAVADLGSPSGAQGTPVTVRYASPTYDGSTRGSPSFRRRVGRGGRLIIDRRGMRLQSKEGIDPALLDRYKFDRDDDDDDEIPVFEYNPNDTASLRYRAAISTGGQPQSHPQAIRRTQVEPTPPGQLPPGVSSLAAVAG